MNGENDVHVNLRKDKAEITFNDLLLFDDMRQVEMVQNYGGIYWSSEEVDSKLKTIMQNIHDNCLKTAANSEYSYKEKSKLIN